MVSASASGAGGREFKSGPELNNLVREPHRNFLKVLIPHRAVIDDFKISVLLYSRPENSKWGEQNFQNGGFLYDFFIKFRNFVRNKMLNIYIK